MNNITVKDLLGVAREKNSKHYEMPPILTIKDKTVETSKTTISDMLSIVRKNKSDNNIKELNPFYEHDVYESAKREANGHIDMLSNMSNSGESVLDDASYVELEKYFDVNAVYAPDGRVLSGGEVLRKYGVTSASSGEIAKNSDTDGLAGIIIDQVNNQKKSPREEVYDGLSPYLTETENARLFSDEAKEMFNAPEGVYQSDYKDRYDYSVNKADNYIGKYDLIIDSIEKNRQLLGDEWADGAIKNANEILDFYKQVKIDAQNYYDYWNQFESEEQYYDYTYAKKYSQSTYGELTSQKNHLYKKMRMEGADTDSIKREIAWIDAHMYDLFYVYTMTDEELSEYREKKNKELFNLRIQRNYLDSTMLKDGSDDYEKKIMDTAEKIKNVGAQIEQLNEGVLGYTDDGIAVTFDNMYAIKKAEEDMSAIQSNEEQRKAWDTALKYNEDIDRLNEFKEEIAKLGITFSSPINIAKGLTDENKAFCEYIARKYGINMLKHGQFDYAAMLEVEKKMQGLDAAAIKSVEAYGYVFEDLLYYNKLKEDIVQSRLDAINNVQYAQDHPVLSTMTSIIQSPLTLFEFGENVFYSAKGFGKKDSIYNVSNVYDDHITNANATYLNTVSNMIYEYVKDKTDSKTIAWLSSTVYSGVTSSLQSALTTTACTAIFGPHVGKAVALALLSSEAAASSFNNAVKNGSTNLEALLMSFVSGASEVLFEKMPMDNYINLGKTMNVSQMSNFILERIQNSNKTFNHALIEMCEETGTEFVNLLADEIINGNHSEYNNMVRSLVEDGYSYEQAREKATQDTMLRILSSSIGGFVGGEVSGGIATTFNMTQSYLGQQNVINILNSDNYNTIRQLQLTEIQNKAITDPDGARRDLRTAMDATLTVSETTTDEQLKSKADSDLERMMKFAQENGIDVSAESSVTQSSNENDHGSERSEGNILQQNITTANAQDSLVADSKQQNRASVKKAATQQKSEVDRESVIRGAYDKVNSSPEALDKVIAEMRSDGINIETLMAIERERILGSLSRAYSEAKYSGVQGDNRGIISYLEAVETAAKDPNYIKRLIAAEYLAQKQLASSDHSASMAIESHSADMSDAADISYSEQTSNSVENISVDNSAENGIIETKTSDARSDIKDVVEIYLSKSSYPESAQHILDAISAGQPDVLTIDREGATANRGEALDGYEKSSEFDLDEYPPAMFKEGGKGASVRAISRSDNRGAGSKIGHQLRKYPNGTKVKIIITD